MISLVLSDLHHIKESPVSCKKKRAITSLSHRNKFDLVLLCGDNAELINDLSNHEDLFGFLKKTFECPIGFIPGNHELWGKVISVSSEKLLYEIFPRVAELMEMKYLESSNIILDGWTIAGTYGHYDYSLGRTGKAVRLENFKTGKLVLNGKENTWNDHEYMDWGKKKNEEVCTELAKGLEKRIKGIEKNLIVITHGAPGYELSGYPSSTIQDFLGAFTGSEKFAQICEKYPVSYYFFGHTHSTAKGKINNATLVNVGSDYKNLAYCILDTEKKEINAGTVGF